MRSLWRLTRLSVSALFVAFGLNTTLKAVEPKDAVPDSASVVARFKTPQVAMGKLGDFVDAAQPGFGGFVRTALPGIGQSIGCPGLIGIDLDQDIWAIGFGESKAPPALVYVVTAKNVEGLKKALLKNYSSFATGNVVAFSDDENALKKVRERLEGSGDSLWSKADATSSKLIDEADFAIYFNGQQLKRAFADELKDAETGIDLAIDRLKYSIPGDPQQMEMALGIYKQIGRVALGVIRDANDWTIGLKFSKDAIRFEDRWQIASGTATSKFLTSQPATELSLVNRLPANKAAYFAAKFDYSTMIQMSVSFLKKSATNLTADQSAQFDSAINDMKQLTFGETAGYIEVTKTVPVIRTGMVAMVTPTDKMRNANLKLWKSLSDLKLPTMKQTAKIEQDFSKVDGASVDRITIKQEIDPSADPTGMAKKTMTALSGEEGMRQLIMWKKDRMLQVQGELDELKQLSTSTDSSANAATATIGAIRQHFPAKSNALVLVDIAQIAVKYMMVASEKDIIPVNTTGLDGLKLEPSFVGYSLSFDPASVHSEFELPVQVVKNLVQIGPFIRPR